MMYGDLKMMHGDLKMMHEDLKMHNDDKELLELLKNNRIASIPVPPVPYGSSVKSENSLLSASQKKNKFYGV